MPTTAQLQQLARTVPTPIPNLDCPFPAQFHVATQRMQHHTTQWAIRHGVLSARAREKFLRYNYGLLIGSAYHYTEPERLSIITDWSTWLFELDDQCDEQGLGHNPQQMALLHAQLLDVISEPEAKHPPVALAQALADVMQRLAPFAPSHWMAAFKQRVADYFQANQWEARNRQNGYVPTEAEYLQQRPFTSGVYIYMLLIEFALGSYLNEAERVETQLQRLATNTNFGICFCNDLVSLQKELIGGDWHNFVYIVADQRNLSFDKAQKIVAERHNLTIADFVKTSNALVTNKPHLTAVVSAMAAWLRANYDWSQMTSRYIQGYEISVAA